MDHAHPAASAASAAPEAPATAHAGALAARRDRAVRAAVAQGLVDDARQPVAALLDVASVRESAAALRTAFAAVTADGQDVLHTFAVKAAALVPVLRLLTDCGIGAEVASPGELALARAAGVSPARTVLDSPAKTGAELSEALALGIAVNADNPQELSRLDALRPSPAARLGLRVNPQLGGGAIDAMSTATATSKFGVALRDEGARDWVVRAYRERPWLTRLHCHVGSQGMALDAMAAGVRATYELAEEINAAAGRRQIDTLDIGGGLPVNFASDETSPTFDAYARHLARTVPGLFDGRYALVTEFGRALLARAGTVLARVEYAKSAGGRAIAVTHAGAQVAVRTVFAPDAWPLRVRAYDAQGRPKDAPAVRQDIAGPCCFAGDLVARDRELPLLAAGDHAALLDTGAYYFSNPFGYNSLPRPGVYGFTCDDAPRERESANGQDGGAAAAAVRFLPVREPQTLDDIVAESGGARRDALL
ncbi:diaminopimelate decarboxylase [Streptomyces armeniacus]|uniref:Diaminopimelate decarboxylase n=1 Tax=Streptomyces armeniacus TaxID=83291 RepID=A0A345XQL0_9ACTN|nr:diaminopimelate decarboxylase [Streptomyces armeniacus]AXK33926.1 diaminopimelate decarboxylase [Streptomyces armeniacus]